MISGQGLGEDQLNVSLEDLLKADQVGRWWIVGSAWEGRKNTTQNVQGLDTILSSGITEIMLGEPYLKNWVF